MKKSIAILSLSACVAFVLANEVSYNASTKHYDISHESANSKAVRQAQAAAAAALTAQQSSNRSNAVAVVNKSLSYFSISAISSSADVTLTWRTNVHVVVNTAYSNANPAKKDDVLLEAIKLYENIITLLTTN